MDSNEKQQLFAQKVQQQNTTLISQLELYKERVRVLENIKGDNNYLNEFLEADRKAKHFNQQAQSQFICDQDIIQDLKQQRDKLDLAVIYYKRQKEEYQNTQLIFNRTQRDKEEKYLNDIIQLQAKNKDLENIVCKMGKSTETLRLLTNEQKAFGDNFRLRISKESKDVSTESKKADTVCNDAFEVTQELSKRIVELEKDLSKFEAKSIAFEIALQHKSRENNSLKTLQKENENFMASLQIENAHLKQTYKDLFESVQRSRVETNECDEVKVKVDFDEIETKNIELEHRGVALIKENEHLKLTYQSLFDSIKKSRVQTKTSNVTQNEAENLKSQLFEFAETKFNNIFGKIEFFKKKQLDISELNKESGEKQNLFENETSVFQIKIDELEKSLAKQIKENFDLLIKIDNLENVFADEEKRATLRKLNAFDKENCDFGSKVDDSKAEKDQFLKEINHLRTQLENLKGKSVKTKFDKSSILGKPPAEKLLITSQPSESWFTSKVDVQKSLSKPVTAQSLPKNEKDQLLKRIAYLE
ncbi:hypothetical protein Tco_0018874 [Tanacetum coccineum]